MYPTPSLLSFDGMEILLFLSFDLKVETLRKYGSDTGKDTSNNV
jgi:hypothetical protein